MSLNWAKKDLTGQHFGRLKVVSENEKRYSNGLILWDCICDCGNTKIVNGASLRKGLSKSCGCLMLEAVRLPEYEASFNKLYSSYVRGAKTRGHYFAITKDDFRNITSQNCFYCGNHPMSESKNNGKRSKFYGNYKYNGIDRVDNDKGYIKENCVSSCFVCNQMKLTMGQTEFIAQCKRISELH